MLIVKFYNKTTTHFILDGKYFFLAFFIFYAIILRKELHIKES